MLKDRSFSQAAVENADHSIMRTSGASTDTPMIIAVCGVALGLLVLFAGGPGELLHVLDRAIQSVGDALLKAYQNFRA